MAEQNMMAGEVLLDVKVAEASKLYKFYLNQEKKILGISAVVVFLTIWELTGGVFQLINPMFMSAPSLIWKAAVGLFRSEEKKILGISAVVVFLTIWELTGGVFQLINPMFMSAPSLIWKAAVGLFASGEIYNDLYIS